MSLDVYLDDINGDRLYSNNITHDLNVMANAAGIYKYLWRPEKIGVKKAYQLIEPLQIGLEKLLNNPDYYKQFNPKNWWGDYDIFVDFVRDYLAACEEYPDAEVGTWR